MKQPPTHNRHKLQENVLRRLEVGLPPTRWQRFQLHLQTFCQRSTKHDLPRMIFHLRGILRTLRQDHTAKFSPRLINRKRQTALTALVANIALMDLTAAPQLTARPAGEDLLLSWVEGAERSAVQFRPDLPNPPEWGFITNRVTTAAATNEVRLTPPGTRGFYRLAPPHSGPFEVLMQCDVGGCGPAQAGWVNLPTCGFYPNVNGSGVNVSLLTGVSAACACRNLGGSGSLANVESDFLFADNQVSTPGADFIITFSNLLPDLTYRLRSFHSRTDQSASQIQSVQVTGATNVSTPGPITQDHSSMAAPADILFTATSSQVSLRYIAPTQAQAGNGAQVFLNGFVLERVPIVVWLPTVQFETGFSSGLESASPAVLSVVLSQALPQTVTVHYAVTGGTATGNGTDYTLTAGLLTFAPGVTRQTISMPITNEGVSETDETIEVTLSNPTGGATLGFRPKHTFTIVDDDTVALPTFAGGVSRGIINIPELDEASGLVASRNNPEVLWTHNDSGNQPLLFAIDTNGRKLGVYTPPGANNVDWEDLGIGPGPVTNVQYLYIADIGDNGASRANIRVYQIPEPAVYVRQYTNPVTANLKGVRLITLNYPDGAHNAESMFIDPWAGDLFIVTKESGTCRVYTAPKAALAASTVTLALVLPVSYSNPSAADISPAGTEIIIRHLNSARLWTRRPGQTIGAAVAGSYLSVPVIGRTTEPQGEAVAFARAGGGYYTLSEGDSPPLYFFQRLNPTGLPVPQTLVPAGAAWRYLDNGSDQGSLWRSPGFNDASWSNGVAQFGYGNGDEQTVVSYGGNASDKHLTTYFRKTFAVNNATSITNLTLRLLVDDGAAVYLNGVNIANYQLATNAGYNTPASATQSPNLEDTWFSFPVSPALLTDGVNTMVVEIHQAAPDDSDLSFDLQLEAE